MTPPIRVLHSIDGLAGGGSERWVWDIVRLSDPGRVQHRVLPIHPDMGRYVYASRLRQVGALARHSPPVHRSLDVAVAHRRSVWDLIGPVVDRLPRLVRSILRVAWHLTVVFPFALWSGLKELRTFNPDVIHAHTFHGLALGVLLARLSNRPLVYTAPALVSQMRDAGYGWVPKFCRRFQHRVMLFLTAYPSEAKAFGIDSTRTVQLDPVGDVAAVRLISENREEWRRKIRASLGLDRDATILLSVGRLHHSKGHQHVIPALGPVVAAFPNTHWVVLGHGEDRADLAVRAAAAGLTRHVHLMGFVNEPLPFYAAADVYLRTAIFEGDNFSSFYAMAMGLPVVAFDTRCETELLTKAGHGVLVPVGDAESLGDRIIDLLQRPERRTEMAARGARYAADHLDIKQTIAKIVAGYSRIAGDGGRPFTHGENLDAEAAERS